MVKLRIRNNQVFEVSAGTGHFHGKIRTHLPRNEFHFSCYATSLLFCWPVVSKVSKSRYGSSEFVSSKYSDAVRPSPRERLTARIGLRRAIMISRMKGGKDRSWTGMFGFHYLYWPNTSCDSSWRSRKLGICIASDSEEASLIVLGITRDLPEMNCSE